MRLGKSYTIVDRIFFSKIIKYVLYLVEKRINKLHHVGNSTLILRVSAIGANVGCYIEKLWKKNLWLCTTKILPVTIELPPNLKENKMSSYFVESVDEYEKREALDVITSYWCLVLMCLRMLLELSGGHWWESQCNDCPQCDRNGLT